MERLVTEVVDLMVSMWMEEMGGVECMGGRRALPAPSHEYYATGGGGGSSYSSGDNTTYETGANAGNGRIIIYQVVSGGGGGVADNLGNHTATQDLNMSGKNIFGVEKLTVNGLVKIGNFTTAARPTCDAAAKGGFIFDTTADKPYICAGAGWKPLDSDNDEDKILTPLDPDDSVVNPVCTANNGGQCFINLNSKNALDTDLAAGNIKKDVDIFGITGTLKSPNLTEAIAFSGDQSHLFPSGGGWWRLRSFSVPSNAETWACNYSVALHGAQRPVSWANTRLVCNGSVLQSGSMISNSGGLEGPPSNTNTWVMAGGTAPNSTI